MAAPSFQTSWISHRHSAGGNPTALTKYISIVKPDKFPAATRSRSFPSRSTGRGVRVTLPSTASGRLQSINKVKSTDAWCRAAAERLISSDRENKTSNTDRRTNVCTGCERSNRTISDASTSGEKMSVTFPGVTFKLGQHRSRNLRSWSETPPESSGRVHLSSMYYINEKNVLESDDACASSLPNISRGKRADVRLLRHLLQRERHKSRAGQHSRQSAPPELATPAARSRLVYTGEGNLQKIDFLFLQFSRYKTFSETQHDEPHCIPENQLLVDMEPYITKL